TPPGQWGGGLHRRGWWTGWVTPGLLLEGRQRRMRRSSRRGKPGGEVTDWGLKGGNLSQLLVRLGGQLRWLRRGYDSLGIFFLFFLTHIFVVRYKNVHVALAMARTKL